MASYIPFKKPGTIVEYTPTMVDELHKCEDDPIYFMENFCYIQTDGGAKLFTPYEYQKDMIKSFVTNRNSVLLTSRQAGKCITGDTVVTLRNKVTGEIVSTTINEFYCKNKGS